MGGVIDIEYLVHLGTIGLWQASQRYDASCGTTLWQWSYRRVKGAMMDEMRRQDAVSRFYRTRLKTEDPVAMGFVMPHHCVLEAAKNVSSSDNPEKSSHAAVRAQMVRSAMAKLSPKDNQLLHRLYFQGQTLNEIGRAWALTEGRICQLKKAALEELKARLEDDLDVDVAEL